VLKFELDRNESEEKQIIEGPTRIGKNLAVELMTKMNLRSL